MGKLDGQVAIVTGGANGIGKAISLAFAQNGANLVIPDKHVEGLHKVKTEIEKLGSRCEIVDADISQPGDVNRVFDLASSKFSKIDILVNNAGINHPHKSILDLDPVYLDKVVDLNFKSVYHCCRRAGLEMKRENKGCIINISSITGMVPVPDIVYGCTKAAVNMLTMVLARDFVRFGIRVNAICPGFTRVERVQESIDRGLSDPSSFLGFILMHMFMEPSDIGNVALFLASDEASRITGSLIVADGGVIAEGAWAAYPPFK